jgi:hypothetical protein
MLNDSVTTILQDRLAPVMAFARISDPDPMKPKTSVVFPKVTVGTTAQTNPTDWEQTTATVDLTTVSMNEYSVSFGITNAELQAGSRIEWLTRIHAAVMANKILDVCMAPLTTANFGTALGPYAATSFGPADLQTIRAAAKNYLIKNLIMDGDYIARLIPYDLESLAFTNGGSRQGFDAIYECNRWSGAGTDVIGAVVDTQAILVVSGLPLMPPGAGTQFASISSEVAGETGIAIQTSSWFKPGTRIQYVAYDLILGAAANDTTAGEVITRS